METEKLGRNEMTKRYLGETVDSHPDSKRPKYSQDSDYALTAPAISDNSIESSISAQLESVITDLSTHPINPNFVLPLSKQIERMISLLSKSLVSIPQPPSDLEVQQHLDKLKIFFEQKPGRNPTKAQNQARKTQISEILNWVLRPLLDDQTQLKFFAYDNQYSLLPLLCNMRLKIDSELLNKVFKLFINNKQNDVVKQQTIKAIQYLINVQMRPTESDPNFRNLVSCIKILDDYNHLYKLKEREIKKSLIGFLFFLPGNLSISILQTVASKTALDLKLAVLQSWISYHWGACHWGSYNSPKKLEPLPCILSYPSFEDEKRAIFFVKHLIHENINELIENLKKPLDENDLRWGGTQKKDDESSPIINYFLFEPGKTNYGSLLFIIGILFRNEELLEIFAQSGFDNYCAMEYSTENNTSAKRK